MFEQTVAEEESFLFPHQSFNDSFGVPAKVHLTIAPGWIPSMGRIEVRTMLGRVLLIENDWGSGSILKVDAYTCEFTTSSNW